MAAEYGRGSESHDRVGGAASITETMSTMYEFLAFPNKQNKYASYNCIT